jgi:quercetin dioxygenase-like cupin family protein
VKRHLALPLMDFFRYDPTLAQPLPESVNTFFIPVRRNDKLAAMVLMLDRKADTGKREVSTDLMLVVVAGTGTLRSGSDVAELQPGDVAILPGRIMYHLWTQDTQLQVLLLNLP